MVLVLNGNRFINPFKLVLLMEINVLHAYNFIYGNIYIFFLRGGRGVSKILSC